MVSYVKISELPVATEATGDSQLEVNQAGISRKITVDQIADVVAEILPPAIPETPEDIDLWPFVEIAGDTMTGALHVTTEPASWSALATQFSAFESNIGDLPPEAQFGGGTTPVVHAVAGLIDIPASSAPPHYGNGSGVSGYARTANTQYAGVGVIGAALAGAASTSAWGANLAVANSAEFGDVTGISRYGLGFDGVNLYGVEIDMSTYKVGAAAPGGNMRAIYIIGAGETLTTGSSVAVWVDSPGYNQSPRLKWNSAYYTEDASAVIALDIGATGVGNPAGSQTIQLRARDAGGVARTATISTDANGALYLSPNGGQPVTTPIINLTGELDFNGGKILDGDGNGVGYNKIYDGSANTSILLGGLADTTNYYRNGTHKLQDRTGGTTFLTVNASGATFSGAVDAQDVEVTAASVPSLRWNATGAGVDQKKWRQFVWEGDGNFYLQSLTDADASGLNFKFGRDGSTTLPGALTGTSATFSGNVTHNSTLAVGAGAATQAFVKASATADLGIYFGTGAPTFNAAKGSIYTNTTATTTTTRLYVNTSGTNTWTNLTTAA